MTITVQKTGNTFAYLVSSEIDSFAVLKIELPNWNQSTDIFT